MRKEWALIDHYRGVEASDIPEKQREIIRKELGIPRGQLWYADENQERHKVVGWKVTQIRGESKMLTTLVIHLDNGRRLNIQAMKFSLMQRQFYSLPPRKKSIKELSHRLEIITEDICDYYNKSCSGCPYPAYNQDTDTMECLLEEGVAIAKKEAKDQEAKA